MQTPCPQKPDLQSDLLKNGSVVSLVKCFISKLVPSRGQHSFPIMGHTESVIGFMGHAVSFITIQLCCGLTAAINNAAGAAGLQ